MATTEKKITKYFRVAKEGATTDGRAIDAAWLLQAAANYNTETYGARINVEHIRGISPEGPFDAYGDVIGLETREEPDGKIALYAQISPTDELIALNKKRQKVYTSCEFAPSFADTGEAYLVGLAVTDNPASLGTQMLTFAAQNPNDSPFTAKKQAPGNLFTVASEELVIELEAAQAPGAGPILLSKVKQLLGLNKKDAVANEQRFSDMSAAVETVATHAAATADTTAKLHKTVNEQATKMTKLETDLATLTEKLSNTADGQPPRPRAAGTGAAELTEF